MDLERTVFGAILMKRLLILELSLAALLMYWMLPAFAQSHNSAPPELIRDTDATEETTNADTAKPKEPDSALSDQNIVIGDFYFKRRNYPAAIRRYLEALEYGPNSIRAYEALARAYEKNGEPTKAINAYKDFIQKNPDSPKSAEFRSRLAKLEKKP
jgi:tetratricopeptide (TPR) repeat protein